MLESKTNAQITTISAERAMIELFTVGYHGAYKAY